jgi:hypothetical protein
MKTLEQLRHYSTDFMDALEILDDLGAMVNNAVQ